MLGYTDDALLDEMAEAFAAGDGAAVFLAIDHVVEAGHDPRRFAMDLLDRLRDLIVLAAVPGAGASGLLDASEDQLERMRKQAAGFGPDRLARAAETISSGLIEMRGATSPRLLLELMCAQVLLPASAAPDRTASESDLGDLAARVERLERELAAGGGAARHETARRQARPPTGAAVATPDRRPSAASGAPLAASAAGAGQPPAAAPAGTLSVEGLRSRWPDVLEAVRDVRKTAWILLSSYASIDTLEGNVLTMAFDSEGNAKGFASSGSDGYLADVLENMFGVRPVIRAIVNPAAGGGGGRGSARRPDGDTGGSGRAAASPAAAAGNTGDAPASGTTNAAPGKRGSAGAGRDAAGTGRRDDDAEQRDSSPPEPAGPAAAGPRARTARAAGSGGRQGPPATHRGPPAGSDLADDPRPLTDAGPGDGGGDLIGTDLVMRELGGRVIDEI